MIDTLISHQADSGLWRQTIRPQRMEGNLSATAMFRIQQLPWGGMQLAQAKYREAIARAWKGL